MFIVDVKQKYNNNIALMHPKDADGMANSVDPWSALFAETYLSQYIEFVRYMACGLSS